MTTKVPLKCQPRSERGLLPSSDLDIAILTLFNSLVGQLKVGLNVFCLEIEKGEYYMGLICWYLQVFKASSSCNDGTDFVFPHQLSIRGCIEIPQQ